MSPVEIVGTVFGLLSVWLTVRENVWLWPTGIISVIAYFVLFNQIKLYADARLQIFFLVTSFIGWYEWLYGSPDKTPLPITRLTRRQVAILAPLLAGVVFLIGYYFSHHTDAHLPFWDATIAGSSVVAQLLLMRKKFENWYLWIFVDVLSVGVYIYKQVYLTAGLYVVFLVLAIGGLIEWKRTLRKAARPMGSLETM